MKLVPLYLGTFALTLLCMTVATNGAVAMAAIDQSKSACGNLLIDEKDMAVADQAEMKALTEQHSLLDLVSADPAKNLAAQHPSIVMNAYQRNLAMILSMGEQTIPNPDMPGGTIKYYNYFEKAGPETGGRMIVGQYEAKEKWVQYLKKGAVGDKSGRTLLVYTGPAGTGKSEILDLSSSGLKYFTLNHPDFYFYVPVFHDLRKVPSLARYIELDDQGNEPEIPLPYPESPLVLLPESVQKKVVELAAPRVRELTKTEADPVLAPGPMAEALRDAILSYYANLKGSPLTTLEAIQALDKHVTIKRLVLGRGSSAPKIDAKDGDINWRGFFIGENPYFVGDPDPNSPFRYTFTGKLLQGNGSIAYLDEIWRNKRQLRDSLLGIIEGRRVSFEFGPTIPMDVVLVAAANSESEAAVFNEGTSKAQFSRAETMPMRWSTYPHEIIQTALLMNFKQLYMQRLGVANAPIEKADLRKLFPLRTFGRPIQGPDYNYALYIGSGPDRVTISPHALMLMAYLTAATRMNRDVKQAMTKLPNANVPQTEIFQDIVARLQVMTYNREVSNAEWAEFSQLQKLLGDGEFGLDMRDVGNKWLPDAIALAREPENENTLTPRVIREAFVKLTTKSEKVITPDNGARLRWLGWMDRITVDMIANDMRDDVMKAFGSKEGFAHEAYKRVIEELLKQEETQGATPKSQFLRDIEQIYGEVNRQPFRAEKFAFYHTRQVQKNAELGITGQDDVPHPELMRAINSYYARNQARVVSLEMLAKAIGSGEADAKTGEVQDAFMRVMMHELGYKSKRAVQEAVLLVKDAEDKKAQLAREGRL